VLAEPVVARAISRPSRLGHGRLRGARREADPGALFKVIGEAAAGHAVRRRVGPGEAVRIFTGAPVPEGADRVVIQEDVTRDGDRSPCRPLDAGPYVRPAGADFAIGGDASTRRAA
jgi:molybdopterin molybdotransferase